MKMKQYQHKDNRSCKKSHLSCCEVNIDQLFNSTCNGRLFLLKTS
jgi:hypothetical protein